MLWKSSALEGCDVRVSDGRIGTVSDFLFDDSSWLIRWMVVDTGKWLAGRRVLLPPSALGHADAVEREFSVRLTEEEVKDSPDIDTDMPVSRQFEADVDRHFGWSPYWGGGYMGLYPYYDYGYGGGEMVASMRSAEVERGRLVGEAVRSDADPHLRSIKAITGHHLHATDGEIGHVSDFLIEDADWSVHFLVADTRNWWPGRHVLLSPASIRKIRWTEQLVYVDADQEKIKAGPAYDPSVTLDRAHEETYRHHYASSEPAAAT